MKKTIFFLTFILFFSSSAYSKKAELDSILQILYKSIDEKELYDRQKMEKIEETKAMLEVPVINQDQRYLINRELLNAYKSFKTDSAIYYGRQNLKIAQELNGITWIFDSKIALSFLLSVSGKYFDSLKILEGIDSSQFHDQPDWIPVEYFGAYKQLYRYYSNLDEKHDRPNEYHTQSMNYRDSLLHIVEPNTYFHIILNVEKLVDENKLQEAETNLLELFNDPRTQGHQRAIVANILAGFYEIVGKKEEQKKYYAISAINDIQNSIKDNASIHKLAVLLYEDGDIDHAHKCIQSSMEDAIFCNARFRTFELNKTFPIIDSAYKEKNQKQKTILLVSLILVSIMSIVLILIVLYVRQQLQRIATMRKELSLANSKLNETNNNLNASNSHLNEVIHQLTNVNSKLTNVNSELMETNHVKEAYLGKFIDLSSNYIDKLNNYRRYLNKIARSEKVEKLLEVLNSSQLIEDELNEFYVNFDETFLNLYPSFIRDFNALFPADYKQEPKAGELLNTELRIYALIRLGIQDSSKIAAFSRCSIKTVYTYRSKLKNKSLYKEDFEDMVMKIGIITTHEEE